ncbi:hypothetical protein [Peribacillus sp. SCS-155]|uniref:hypothetical protein n=1 Tax=Peribacillus sedimenti TaxID=3115297 RepID=UPI0039058C2F
MYSNQKRPLSARIADVLFRFLVLAVGLSLAVSGCLTAVAYLNLLAAGHNVFEYIFFLLTSIEFYLLPIGLVMIWGSLYI